MNKNEQEHNSLSADVELAMQRMEEFRASMQAQRVEEFRKTVEAMLIQAEQHEVFDEPSSASALSMAVQAKNLFERLETRRKEFISPSQTFVKEVNAFSKTLTEPLKTIFTTLKNKATAYQLSQMDQRRATSHKPVVIQQEDAKLSIRRKKSIRVIDPSAVPRLYCSPDLDLLQQAIDSGATDIPGCEIFEEIQPTLFRRS